MVIDDNPINLKLTAALIRNAGFLVEAVETAESALKLLDLNRPDLIVTDLQMPGMDGLGLTLAVKTNPAWRSIPVILLTAEDSQETEVRAREAGCASLICKPVDARLFPGLIAAVMGTTVPVNAASSLEGLPIEELRGAFLASGAADCRELLSEFTSSRLFVPALDLVLIRQALHRWAGVGGTLGFPDISRKARALEALAKVYDSRKRDELREKLFELLHQFTHAKPLEQSPAAMPTAGPPVGNGFAAVTWKPVILVADDDPTLRAFVKLSLDCLGFVCRLADNGALACTLARNDPPDAIVLDVDMPRMNGFEVLYALRNQWCTRKIPVILLTARREEADIANAAQLGALDYMTKPFEINDLIARLHAMVAPKHPKLALRSEA